MSSYVGVDLNMTDFSVNMYKVLKLKLSYSHKFSTRLFTNQS